MFLLKRIYFTQGIFTFILEKAIVIPLHILQWGLICLAIEFPKNQTNEVERPISFLVACPSHIIVNIIFCQF